MAIVITRLGKACQGVALLGWAWQGLQRSGLHLRRGCFPVLSTTRQCEARLGAVGQDAVRQGLIQRSATSQEVVERCGSIMRYGMARLGMPWRGRARQGLLVSVMAFR